MGSSPQHYICHEPTTIKIKTRIRMPSTGLESSKGSNKSAFSLSGKKIQKEKGFITFLGNNDNNHRMKSYV